MNKAILLFIILTACTQAPLPSIQINENINTNASTNNINSSIEQNRTEINITENNAGKTTTNKTTENTSKQENAVKPEFSFKYPKEGIKLKGDAVSVSLIIRNMTIGQIGANNTWGDGHFHYYIDDGNYNEMEDTSKTIRGLKKGMRKLTIEIVMNDHTSYGIKHSVNFEAQTVTKGEQSV